MKTDMDFIYEYMETQAELKYGCDYEQLGEEAQFSLYEEAENELFEKKINEAEAKAELEAENEILKDEDYNGERQENFCNWKMKKITLLEIKKAEFESIINPCFITKEIVRRLKANYILENRNI